MSAQDPEMAGLLREAREYRDYAQLARTVHYHMADRRAWVNQLVGGLTVLAAAVVSTGILTHVKTHPSFTLTLVGGIVAFIAAVLAGLQSFYKFGEVAEKHRSAAADYGDVRKRLELFLVQYAAEAPGDAPQALKDLEALAAELSGLDRKGPGFPSRLYRRAQQVHNESAAIVGGRDRGGSLPLSLGPRRASHGSGKPPPSRG